MYESGEDYLETILILQNTNGFVRSVDIAKKLGFSKPSVSRAMAILEKDGYIEFGLANMIVLTEKGQQKANDVYARHQLLTKFFVKITGVDEKQAEKNKAKYNDSRRKEIIDTDAVYANFTSGSTGVPKAVIVSHRSVIDFISCFTELFEITANDNIANQAPFSFYLPFCP